MRPAEAAKAALQDWLAALPRIRGLPARGTIGGALIVLERLKGDFDLDIDAHTAAGGSQVKGAGGGALKQILARLGETRPFLSEGGRTNRGLRGAIAALLRALAHAGLDEMPPDQRTLILEDLQRELLGVVVEYHNRERIALPYDANKTTWQLIHDLMEGAKDAGKGPAVAQYLVGAKLQVRFPELPIENLSLSTADQPLARAGDFDVGDTALHVTLTPSPGLWDKCLRNLQQGLRVLVLVPHNIVQETEQIAALTAPGRISVSSLESFVAQNVDELSGFSHQASRQGLRRLLEAYNERVDAIEMDKSMLVEFPANL